MRDLLVIPDAAKFVASGAVGTVGEVAAGYAGAAVSAARGTEEGAKTVQKVRDLLSYTPDYQSDQAAQLASGAVGQAATSFARGSETVEKRTGQFVMEATGSAALAAVAQGAVRVIPELQTKWFRAGVPRNRIVESAKVPAEIEKAEALRTSGKSTMDIIDETGMWRGPDGVWRQWISDKDAEVDMDALPEGDLSGQTIELSAGEFLNHPELYKKHPYARDVNVAITFDPEAPEKAWFNPNDNTVYMFVREKNKNKAARTILHELQHVVQQRDALVAGANIDVAKQVVRSLRLGPKVRELRKKEAELAKQGDKEELMNVQVALSVVDPEFRYTHNLGELEARLAGTQLEKRAGASGSDMAKLAAAKAEGPLTNIADIDWEQVAARKGELTLDDLIASVPAAANNPDVLKYLKESTRE